MSNYLCKSLVSLLGCLLSCATPIPDVPACVELNPSKAGCVKVISGDTFTIDDKNPFTIDGKAYTYWEMRPLMIQIPPYSWAEIKSFIRKICKKHENTCQREVGSWDNTLNEIDENLQNKTSRSIEE